ncbi:MAG: small basic protein [Candidatus Omnitrophota bacterium]
MSIHSSLRGGGKGRKHRSVLKRHERLKALKDKNLWDESKSVLGIPKVKMQKLKVKKEKTASAEEKTVAGPGAPAAPAAPAKGEKK